MFQILVVEDDKNLCQLIKTVLEQNGYTVYQAKNGQQALDIMDHYHVDLVITDIMMPDIDGIELTKILRQADDDLPILMVTAKDAFEDKQKGFAVGTDDYMVKPIDLGELLLRISALLRRAKIVHDHQLTVGELVLDYDALTVSKGDDKITLPKKEFYLLYKLLSYPDVIFTRFQLMDEIWGMDSQADDRTVDVHIKRLREKFEAYKEFRIVTIRGLGYKAELTKN